MARKGVAKTDETMLCQTPGIEQVTLTTNGVFLKEKLPVLQQAGVHSVNISLDTMDRGSNIRS